MTRDERNRDARKLLAYFYAGYEQVGSRNFGISPQKPGVLDDVELSMRAYKGAMHRLIDLGALEAQTLGGGCGITPFGVELSEDRQLLQQELPVSRTPYTSEGSDEPYPVSRRDLRRLLRGVMRLSQQVAEREQFDVEETTAWLQRVDASVPPLRAELNAPSEPLRRACDGQGATRAELLDGLSEIRGSASRAQVREPRPDSCRRRAVPSLPRSAP